MAEIEFDDASAYLARKTPALKELPIDAIEFRFQKEMYGWMAGKSLIELHVYSKSPHQALRRAIRHLLSDAPCHLRLNLHDTQKKPSMWKGGRHILFDCEESE